MFSYQSLGKQTLIISAGTPLTFVGWRAKSGKAHCPFLPPWSLPTWQGASGTCRGPHTTEHPPREGACESLWPAWAC